MNEQLEKESLGKEFPEGNQELSADKALQGIDEKALEIIRSAETKRISMERENEQRIGNMDVDAERAEITTEERQRIKDSMGMEDRMKFLEIMADCQADAARIDAARISSEKMLESPVLPDPEKRKTLIKFIGGAAALIGSKMGPSEAWAGEKEKKRQRYELPPELKDKYEALPADKAEQILTDLVMNDHRERPYFYVDGRTYLQNEAGYESFGYVDLSIVDDAAKNKAKDILVGHTHPFEMYRKCDPDGHQQYMKDQQEGNESRLAPGYNVPSLVDIQLAGKLLRNEKRKDTRFEARDAKGVWRYGLDQNNPFMKQYCDLLEDMEQLYTPEFREKIFSQSMSADDRAIIESSVNLKRVCQETDPRELFQGRSDQMPLLNEREKEILVKLKNAIESETIRIVTKYDISALVKFHEYSLKGEKLGKFYEKDKDNRDDGFRSLLLRDTETMRMNDLKQFIKGAEDIGIRLDFRPYQQ